MNNSLGLCAKRDQIILTRVDINASLVFLFCVIFACIVFAGQSYGHSPELVSVYVKTDRVAPGNIASEALSARSKSSTPMRVIEVKKGGIILETSFSGYHDLLANPNLYKVKLLGRNKIKNKIAKENLHKRVPHVTYEIGLVSDAADAATTLEGQLGHTYTASIENRGRVVATLDSAVMGPGMLLVQAFDASGAELYSTAIPDTRLVRYEEADQNGNLKGRRDFYRTSATLIVRLPQNDDIRTLTISAPIRGALVELAALEVD